MILKVSNNLRNMQLKFQVDNHKKVILYSKTKFSFVQDLYIDV